MSDFWVVKFLALSRVLVICSFNCSQCNLQLAEIMMLYLLLQVKKMQKDINKTGQVSQDLEAEESMVVDLCQMSPATFFGK